MYNSIQLYLYSIYLCSKSEDNSHYFWPQGFGEWQNFVNGPQNFKYLIWLLTQGQFRKMVHSLWKPLMKENIQEQNNLRPSDERNLCGPTQLDGVRTTELTVVAGFWNQREVLVLVCTSAHSPEFSVKLCSFFLSPNWKHPPSNYLTRDLLPLNCLTNDPFFASFSQTMSPVNSVEMEILSQRPGASSHHLQTTFRLDKWAVGCLVNDGQ